MRSRSTGPSFTRAKCFPVFLKAIKLAKETLAGRMDLYYAMGQGGEWFSLDI